MVFFSLIRKKKEAIISCLKARTGFDGYIWNGIYKKNIIPFFDEHKTLSEDLEFSVMALMNIATECVLMMKDSYKYNYRVRTSGSRKLDIHERYKYTIDALANIKKKNGCRENDGRVYLQCILRKMHENGF